MQRQSILDPDGNKVGNSYRKIEQSQRVEDSSDETITEEEEQISISSRSNFSIDSKEEKEF